MSLSKFNENVNNHQSLPDKPTLPAEDLKVLWDKAVNDIKTYINTILTEEIDGVIENINSSKAPNNHAVDNSTYGLGEAWKYGHCRVVDGLGKSTFENGEALSAHQGKILKELIDAKAPKLHTSTDFTYGVGSTTHYGHAKVRNDCNLSTHEQGVALSAYQGYFLNRRIDTIYNSIMNTLEQLNQRVTALERKVK